MHIHTNAFHLVEPDGSVERAWRDVALVKAGSRLRLRIKFEDFAERPFSTATSWITRTAA